MNNFNARKILIILISITLISLCGCAASNKKNFGSVTGFYFDTIIDIKIYDENISPSETNIILNDCLEKCAYYEKIFSKTLTDSDLYKVNHSNCNPQIVNKELITLLKEALLIEEQSNGIVSPSIGALTNCWNIGKDDFSIPSQSKIEEALLHIDSQKIIIDEEYQTIQLLDPELQIDLGFIAKGYIADKLKELILSKNISSAIINLGGNVLTIGSKNGEPFNIGIKDPIDSNHIITNVEITDKSVVSSGDYERYSEENGVRYHHILSTQTGYPVGINDTENSNDALSQVTIISDDSLTGDKLSTLCFILGYEDSLHFLNKYYPNVQAIFVNKKGEVIGK